jgi:glycosyltransferase involved in cell wall biosynthesis
LHLADAVICPSQVTANYLTSLGLPREKISVIPNGIDPDLFRFPNPQFPHPSDGQSNPQSLISNPQSPRPSDGQPNLLYLGTLADWQGIEVLIAAMPLVLARRPVRLRLVGPGRKAQLKSLQKRLRKMGLAECVSLEPAISHADAPALITQADVCVAPLGYNDRNVNQGCCPIKVLEYMACGRPIVAADLPVVRELVCAGQEALLFTPDDPADLARKILTILDDSALAAHLGRQAAIRAHRQFTWPMAQAHLLSVYQALLKLSTF